MNRLALSTLVPLLALTACGGDEGTLRTLLPRMYDMVELVPGTGMPAQVSVDRANNNLDVVAHDGRTFLAFRTAPSHFATPEALLYVVSSVDQVNWEFEGEFSFNTDVREPQLVSWNGELFLYFAVLGQDATAFEPVGTRYVKYLGQPGQWSDLQLYPTETFVVWRIKEVDGELYMTGYSGGEDIYDPVEPEPIQLHWLKSTDAINWTGVAPQGAVIQEGGGSEMDFVYLQDGRGIAVIRNAAGDEDGFGSKICEISAADRGNWTCVADPRMFESPNLFLRGDEVWLVARRHLTTSGNYDLGQSGSLEDQYAQYQLAYRKEAKRCSLWRVDPDTLEVTLQADLPSVGDTCYPEVLPVAGDTDSFTIYNYSNDPDGPDYILLDGQLEETNIYRVTVTLP
jgi:hypothetical protein